MRFLGVSASTGTRCAPAYKPGVSPTRKGWLHVPVELGPNAGEVELAREAEPPRVPGPGRPGERPPRSPRPEVDPGVGALHDAIEDLVEGVSLAAEQDHVEVVVCKVLEAPEGVLGDFFGLLEGALGHVGPAHEGPVVDHVWVRDRDPVLGRLRPHHQGDVAAVVGVVGRAAPELEGDLRVVLKPRGPREGDARVDVGRV